MDRRHLSAEEREEYDALLHDAGYDEHGQRRPSAEIGERMHELLTDAIRAGRNWARYVVVDDARSGHLKRFKRWDKSRHVVEINHEQVLVPRAAVMGVKRKNAETGAVYHQQALFAEMAWDELVDVMEAAQSRIAAAQITVGTCAKLLALKVRCPDSTGPADACTRLRLDMDAYLRADETAA
ncbi:hypothetical protein CDO52_00910 [Nocardiopsis gilva YIM 90087]|uniref:Uncharacterized protein n=1 Tax=Nocardiopsis gilva YIM 90087 TaxID=1235441 RepID=A0A223S0J1_9ACTN|nr:hypothetical protein [Nocardiopsis gilva]ASU81539.1 hypothetical protein CDO52_00910 [Nocardiopsis gilva YIM 90087]